MKSKLDMRIVKTEDDVDRMIEDLTGAVSYDIETTQLYPWQSRTQNKDGTWSDDPEPKIISIGFGTKNHQWCMPVHHPESPWSHDQVEYVLDSITECRDRFTLITHNGKFDLLWTWVHFGVQWENDFDTMLAHFLLNENSRHGLKHLAKVFCNAPDWEIDLDKKKGINVPLTQHCKYLAHDVYYTRKLRYRFASMLRKDPEVKRVFDKILMPCSNIFTEIEYDGVVIDTSKFDEAERVLENQYSSALNELRQWEPKHTVDAKGWPQPFNWGSPVQLSKLLFKDLGLEPLDKTPAGNPSTSESVIKRLDHPCTDALLKFRAAKQQLSFFINGWKPYLHRKSKTLNLLHPSFKLHGTVTGRLSCEHPNLQQVPRDPRIRSIISAEPGWSLLQFDLSQAELRITAEISGEKAMTQSFLNGEDVHWKTAITEIARGAGLKDLVIKTGKELSDNSNIKYGDAINLILKAGHTKCEEIDSRWKEHRKKAKATNFGFIYGMWWKKFKIYARDSYGISLTDAQAKMSRQSFFDTYSGLKSWHERQIRYGRRHGYVKTLSGRKRRLPAMQHVEDTPERRSAERQSINSPVQSFANELTLMALIQLKNEYSRNGVKVCGTNHDAILMRVHNTLVPEVYERMKEIMRHPDLLDEFGIKLTVPIEADGEIGPWGKGVTLEKWREAYGSV